MRTRRKPNCSLVSVEPVHLELSRFGGPCLQARRHGSGRTLSWMVASVRDSPEGRMMSVPLDVDSEMRPTAELANSNLWTGSRPTSAARRWATAFRMYKIMSTVSHNSFH